MARLALGAKWGSPGRPPVCWALSALAAACWAVSVARAAAPRPRAPRAKKWRRVIRVRWSWVGSIAVLPLGGRLFWLPDHSGAERGVWHAALAWRGGGRRYG